LGILASHLSARKVVIMTCHCGTFYVCHECGELEREKKQLEARIERNRLERLERDTRPSYTTRIVEVERPVIITRPVVETRTVYASGVDPTDALLVGSLGYLGGKLIYKGLKKAFSKDEEKKSSKRR
jgi:hypothetical protein